MYINPFLCIYKMSNIAELKRLKEHIEKMDKSNQIDILKILRDSNKVILNENKSGVYINPIDKRGVDAEHRRPRHGVALLDPGAVLVQCPRLGLVVREQCIGAVLAHEAPNVGKHLLVFSRTAELTGCTFTVAAFPAGFIHRDAG